MRYILIALAMLWLTACQSPQVASKEWFTVCGSLDGASWCYHELGTPDISKPVILFAHGAGDSEQVFIHPVAVPSSYPDWIANMPRGTRVLVISYGKAWLLTGYPNRTKDPARATLENYKATLAKLSVKLKLMPPFRLVSHSMGAINSLQLCAKMPELFTHCAFINGMFLKDDVDPWNWVQICPQCLLIKPNYDNLAQYRADKPQPSAKMPPVWMSGCKNDIFLLYSGETEMRDKLASAGVKVTWSEDQAPCNHFHWDYKDMMEFLK